MSVAATHEDLIEAIRTEMAFSVRQMGGDGKAKDQNRRAARFTGLPITTIERLRWKKMQRVPADLADWVRIKLDQYNDHVERLARHENEILRAQLEAALAVGGAGDPSHGSPAAGQAGQRPEAMVTTRCERCERTGGARRSVD